jgi:deoxyribodipyrimidine photo-lyase
MSSHHSEKIVVWFKRDLRIHDHAPLYEATRHGAQVLCLYIVEPDYWQLPDSSERHWRFIADSLRDLETQIRSYGTALTLRQGDALAVFEDLRTSLGQFTLYSHCISSYDLRLKQRP